MYLNKMCEFFCGKWRENIQTNLILSLVFLVCTFYLLLQVKLLAYNLVFSDQIDLFFGYLQNKNLITLFFQQHGPHRQGLGSLVMFPILKLANWDIRALSYLTFLVMIVSVLFWILSLRIKKIPLIPAIAIIVLSLSLGSVELLTITPNISHSALPILFSSLLFWLVLKYRFIGLWPNLASLIVLIFSLFTGFGIFLFFSYFVVFCIKELSIFSQKKLQHDSIVATLSTCIVFVFSLVIFFIDYNYSKGEGCSASALSNIGQVLRYVFAVTSIPFGGSRLGAIAIPVGFLVICMMSVIAFIATRNVITKKDITSFALLVMIMTSVGFVINVAIGRHCLGIDSAYASRYYQIASLGVIASIFALSDWCRGKFSYVISTMTVILILVTFLVINPSMKQMGEDFFGLKKNFNSCLDSGGSLHDCNIKFKIYPPDDQRLGSILAMIKKTNR